MTPNSKLREAARAVLEADEQVKSGHLNERAYWLELLEHRSANSAPALARAVLVLEEALHWIMPKVHQGNHDGSFDDCGKATCVEYRNALSKAEKEFE